MGNSANFGMDDVNRSQILCRLYGAFISRVALYESPSPKFRVPANIVSAHDSRSALTSECKGVAPAVAAKTWPEYGRACQCKRRPKGGSLEYRSVGTAGVTAGEESPGGDANSCTCEGTVHSTPTASAAYPAVHGQSSAQGCSVPKPRLASLGQVSTNCTKAEAVTAIHCSMFHNPYEDCDPRQPGCSLCQVHSLLTRCKRYCLRANERRHHRSPMQITSTATP